MYEEIFNQIRSAANKRNLKDSTIHAYCTSVAHFLNHTAKDIDALTTDDVDIFLTEKKLSGILPETYNHYHSGIRFFYKKILKKNWDDDDIPRMKRDRKLPTVLTKTEISAILDATPNLKHKAMIATMYSGGLRVSEVTHLHYDDISRTNKTIHIRDGKSRSDRYTLLADRTLLNAPYYHVVFTVPEELNSIIYSNQKLLYDALYHAASATLNELSKDAKYLGADIGYICILHTWGSAMNYHPHIHTIVI